MTLFASIKNENGNRKLHPVFWELLGAGWTKCSVCNSVVPGQCGLSGWEHPTTEAQDKISGPLSERPPVWCQRDPPDRDKGGCTQTTTGSCCKPCPHKTPEEPTFFRGSFSTHQHVHGREKSVTLLNPHSDPERGWHCRVQVVKDAHQRPRATLGVGWRFLPSRPLELVYG